MHDLFPNLRRAGTFIAALALLAGAVCDDVTTASPDASVNPDAAVTPDANEPGTRYTLTVAPGAPPLSISNETLALPLGLGATTQTVSKEALGDVVLAYTRVGCTVEPNGWIGPIGAAPVKLRAAAPVRLIGFAVDEVGNEINEPAALARQTCLTLRGTDGVWRAFVAPTRSVVNGMAVHVEFDVDAAGVDAAAVFLPTYTSIGGLSYRIGAR